MTRSVVSAYSRLWSRLAARPARLGLHTLEPREVPAVEVGNGA